MSVFASGHTVGRYRIVRPLGAGAMGEVYLARDPRIDRPIAIKTVRPVAASPAATSERRQRLLREAKTAGSLSHPHVVTLFDAGEQEGLVYLAFEYVDGPSLERRLADGGPPPVWEALRIVRQAAEGLAYAHEQGVVHRDVKPANLLLDSQGRVKVSDFGIAKVEGQATRLTLTGSVIGSPQYLSPEQVRGEALDGRSDLFSLGVVFYELLGGRPPFAADTLSTLLYQILERAPEPLELPAPLATGAGEILDRLLAKRPEERYADAGTVVAALGDLERSLPEEILAAPVAASLAGPTRVILGAAAATEGAATETLREGHSAPAATRPAGGPYPPGTTRAAGALVPPQVAARPSRRWLGMAALLAAAVVLAAAFGVMAVRNAAEDGGEPFAASEREAVAEFATPVAELELSDEPAPPEGGRFPGAASAPGPDPVGDTDAPAAEAAQERTEVSQSGSPRVVAPAERSPVEAQPEPRALPPAALELRRTVRQRLAERQRAGAADGAAAPELAPPSPEEVLRVRVREGIAFSAFPPTTEVAVDGRRVGPARQFPGRFARPATWLRLAPGRHRVSLVAPGFRRRDVLVEIAPEAAESWRRVDVRLEPLP